MKSFKDGTDNIFFLRDFPRSQPTPGSLMLANILKNYSKNSRGF